MRRVRTKSRKSKPVDGVKEEDRIISGLISISSMRIRIACSFRVYVSLCHNTNRYIRGYASHEPIFTPSCPSKYIPAPLQKSDSIIFPTLAEFAVALGL